MDFAYAVTYIFEDRQWVRKLVLLAVFTFFSLLPLVGLLPFAVVVGYLYEIAVNVRLGRPRPLPKWTNYERRFAQGAQILLAMVVYHLPLIVFGCGGTWIFSAVAGGFLGDTLSFVLLCCATPLLLIYLAIAWPLLATGIAEQIETGDARRMFRLVHLWDVLSNNGILAAQWVAYTLLVNIATMLLFAFPCIGWILALLFAVPVQGHLLGQFTHKLSLTNKPEPRKRPAPQR